MWADLHQGQQNSMAGYKDDSAHDGDVAPGKDPMRSLDSGEARMAALGYKQEFKRDFGMFA